MSAWKTEAIIHVGSLKAGIELLDRVDKPYVVDTFFGVGDPGESSNDLLIALKLVHVLAPKNFNSRDCRTRPLRSKKLLQFFHQKI